MEKGMTIHNSKFKKCSVFLLSLFFLFQTLEEYSFAGHAGQDLHGDQPEEEEKKEECKEKDPECCPKKGEPVYLYSGEFFYTHVDIELPGRLPIKIRRHYSAFGTYNGAFGYGWIHNYDTRLYRSSDGNLLLRRGCYNRAVFTFVGGNQYASPADEFETITENEDGTYTLYTREGLLYQYDINGSLASIDDANGNQLVFTYNPAGKLPIIGISPYSNLSTPIVIGYAYRLTRIEQYSGGVATGRYLTFDYNDNGRIVQIADSFGRSVFYIYHESQNGDLVSFLDAEGIPYEYNYNQKHLMTSFVGQGCSDCSVHHNTYDSKNRLIRQTHGNYRIEFNYQIPLEKTKVTTYVYDDATRQLLRTYIEYSEFDSNRNLIKSTRQMGQELDSEPGATEADDIVESHVYNAQSLMTQKTDPNGNVTNYTYDSNGNLLTESVTLASGEAITKTYTYDFTINYQQKKTSETISSTHDPQSYRTEYVYYPGTGNLHQERRILDESTAYITSYTYTANGDIDTITYPNGNQVSYQYNDFGQVTREFAPANPSHQTTYAYDNWGNRTSITDANTNTTEFTYDSLNRLTSITNPLGEQIIYTWTDANLTQIEQGKTDTHSGHITRIIYDDLNRKTDVIRETSEGALTIAQYTYDSEGNILSVTDTNGNASSYTYDLIGRLSSVTDPLGNTTTYTYDKNSNLTSITDAELNINTYQYDGLNRLTTVIQPQVDGENPTTRYTYNAIGNVTSIADAESHTTTNTYDRLGRLVRIEDPLGHITQYFYNGNDNLDYKIDANGDTIDYDYNDYNELKVITYPDHTVRFSYDNTGNLTSYNDGIISTSYTYDALNRKEDVTVTYPFGDRAISYTYDRFGNRSTSAYPDIGEIRYFYDDMDRLTNIFQQTQQVVNYQYDDTSRITTKTLANRATTSYTYDDANRLLSVIASGSEPISYTYDNVGNRLTKTGTDGEHSYTYDSLYRLSTATLPDEAYTYDRVGNRLTNQDHNDWTYNTNNQFTHYNSTDFTYDNNGNTISKTTTDGTTTYAWDYENRLTTINHQLSTINCSYDPFGKRLSKTVDGVTIYYLYDNEDIIAEYDNAGTLTRSYIHGQGIDEPLVMTNAATSTNYYYLSDGLGSITEIQDSTGTTVEKYRYDSFGNPTILAADATELTESAISNPYMFTAREWDTETQLYYYRARYYDPGVGRFLSEDPILKPFKYNNKFGNFVFALQNNPQIFNAYQYIQNNPVNDIDPYGLFNWKKFFKCAACYATLAAELAWAIRGADCPTPQAVKDAITRFKACKSLHCTGGFDDDDEDDEWDESFPPGTVPTPWGPMGPYVPTPEGPFGSVYNI